MPSDRLWRTLENRLKEHLWRHRYPINPADLELVVRPVWTVAALTRWSDERIEEWAVMQAAAMADPDGRTALEKLGAVLQALGEVGGWNGA